MWTITERIYREYKEGRMEYGLGEQVSTKTFKYMSPDKVLHLLETLGYEQDRLFTFSEWGRWVLTKFIPGKGLVEITIEEEE